MLIFVVCCTARGTPESLLCAAFEAFSTTAVDISTSNTTVRTGFSVQRDRQQTADNTRHQTSLGPGPCALRHVQ